MKEEQRRGHARGACTKVAAQISRRLATSGAPGSGRPVGRSGLCASGCQSGPTAAEESPLTAAPQDPKPQLVEGSADA